MRNRFNRVALTCAAFLVALVVGGHPAFAASLNYGPGGLPDLTAYRVGTARFEDMATGLGTPVSLSTSGANAVTDAIWWLPAEGYTAPAATTTAQRATQAASLGFFSRMRSQAVGTVARMVPGMGGVVAGQAATAVAASVPAGQSDGTAIPGWWCRATYAGSEATLASISCAPHAYTPMR
ncbi:MAG: hypothetical protein ACTHOL_18590 [Luteibacter jiangsuensis]